MQLRWSNSRFPKIAIQAVVFRTGGFCFVEGGVLLIVDCWL